MPVDLKDKWKDPDFRHPDRKPHTLHKLNEDKGITLVVDTEKCPQWYDKVSKLIQSCKRHSVKACMLYPQNKVQIMSEEPLNELVSDIIQRNFFYDWYKIEGDKKRDLKVYPI